MRRWKEQVVECEKVEDMSVKDDGGGGAEKVKVEDGGGGEMDARVGVGL